MVDPLSRPNINVAGDAWIYTSYPSKVTPVFPFIVVKIADNRDLQNAGQQSQAKLVAIILRVRIYTRRVDQRDKLTQQAYDFLRKNQLTATTGSYANGLLTFELTSNVPLDEDGQDGSHDQIMQIKYTAVLT